MDISLSLYASIIDTVGRIIIVSSVLGLMSHISCLSDVFLLIALLFLNLLEFLLFDKLDFFDDESYDDGSGSGSPGTCAFPF